MYRKLVWCYVFVLTLLDTSLNTKLSAQGKSHGVTVHDSLIEGITFQEWGKESGAEGGARGGRAVAADALLLSPPALDFGRAALAAAHALTVTLTNTANTTMHLASVAGTTPDFHASFFESKTLPPQANTTFSVVYLGRREGPVSAHLYIHTSLGVHKYPVAAEGAPSPWGVWPLLGVRVPLNASVEPLLTMHNPTDHTIQVSEVYSSGAWLGLVLPGGGESAPRAAWSVPPRASRALVRLRVAPPAAPAAHPLTAYVRIKANITGGGLVVCVEARSVPAGEYLSPLQLRLRTRGSQDPPDVFDIAAGNSAAAAVSLDAAVWAARCGPAPPAPPAPPDPALPTANGDSDKGTANGDSDKGTANGNGAVGDGVHVSLLTHALPPHAPPARAALLTLDYAKMWAGAAGGEGGEGGAGGEGGVWCGGWARVGRGALPYSVRVLPGTLRLPPALHFVTSNGEEALRVRDVSVRNEFPVPVHIAHVQLGADVDKYFEVESLAPRTLAPGGGGVAARVRLRSAHPRNLRALLTLRTNLSDYALPLLLYSGQLQLEWEWPNSADGTLRLGVVGTSSTRRVRVTLRNPAPCALCVRELRAELPGATLALQPCAPLRAPPPRHACRCVAAGEAAAAWLTVVAPARAGAVRGAVSLWAGAPDAPHALPARHAVTLDAQPGHVLALPLLLHHAAPYAWASAPLVLESSMALRMRVLSVSTPPDEPAIFYEPAAEPLSSEVSAGQHAVGTVHYAAERVCAPHCYTGLDVTRPEGQAWLRRADEPTDEALQEDAALLAARQAQFAGEAARDVLLHVHTTHAVQLAARARVAPAWPRLAPRAAAAGLAPVRAAVPLRLRARNPSASHALLLQPVLAGPLPQIAGSAAWCAAPCEWARGAFALLEWRAARGGVRAWRGGARGDGSLRALAPLLLAPRAELELRLSFTPARAAALGAVLYLRNNLTVLEAVQLSGRGAHPSFELGGRRPGADAPLVFEVSECGGAVRRTLVARNTGPVRLRLRDWRVAGQPCQARGFRLTPCAPLALAPNESRALTLAFAPDYTLARAAAELSAAADGARLAFQLRAVVPARLLPPCRALRPRPPWEPAARAAAALLALAVLVLVLAAAALDAERELRRARQARPPPASRRPLDLRALSAHAPAAPAPRRPAARRRRTPRRDAPPPDPLAERRAFERWRADVLRRAGDDDSRSSDDVDGDDDRRAPSPPDAADLAPLLDSEMPASHDEPPPVNDGYEADPETEDRPQGSGDDDAVSTGSRSTSASSSSPIVDDHDEPDDGEEQEMEPPHSSGETRGSRAAPSPPRGDSSGEAPRTPRARRDSGGTPRRAPRSRTAEGADAGRRAGGKPATRKLARRGRPASPARAEAPRPGARPAGALRWGASWSSVVARGPLAPIGSDVRRRAEPAAAAAGGGAGDHSLFYFNGDAAHTHAARDADFSWRPPPPVERPAFAPARDFLDENIRLESGGGAGAVGSGALRPLSAVWGAAPEPRPGAAAWLWGYGEAAPVRPPPGFGAARPARAYDPFRSLHSIWAPGALDWRDADAAPPDEPQPPHH